ncbi:MAG: hypothetical protein LBG76_05820 [Treponema sp.]|nr:hypothetical protein [Treponema sp.]
MERVSGQNTRIYDGSRIIGGILLASFLSSCVGLGSDITIKKDGSGIAKLEYRISRELESLGKFDGNEGRPPIPTGKTDFERTAARIEGLKVASFSTKTVGSDVISNVTLEFSHTAALLRFLDATGQGASLTEENGKRRLSLTLSGGKPSDPELAALLKASFAGYTADMSFKLPNDAELFFSGADGRLPVPPVGQASVQGGKVAFSAEMGDLLTAGPLTMEIVW